MTEEGQILTLNEIDKLELDNLSKIDEHVLDELDSPTQRMNPNAIDSAVDYALNNIIDEHVLDELDSSTQEMNPNAVEFVRRIIFPLLLSKLTGINKSKPKSWNETSIQTKQKALGMKCSLTYSGLDDSSNQSDAAINGRETVQFSIVRKTKEIHDCIWNCV